MKKKEIIVAIIALRIKLEPCSIIWAERELRNFADHWAKNWRAVFTASEFSRKEVR